MAATLPGSTGERRIATRRGAMPSLLGVLLTAGTMKMRGGLRVDRAVQRLRDQSGVGWGNPRLWCRDG